MEGFLATVITIATFVGALICWIIILVKLFQAGYTVQGVLGIFCGIVAFIYGWAKADEMDAKPIMLAWTACIVAYVISLFVTASSGVNALPQ